MKGAISPRAVHTLLTYRVQPFKLQDVFALCAALYYIPTTHTKQSADYCLVVKLTGSRLFALTDGIIDYPE